MFPNWYEATVTLVLIGGIAMVAGIVFYAGLTIWYRFNPPKRGGRASDCPGPR